MKTKIEITASHPAFGDVTFVVSAEDAKQAFCLWKQIVHSSRQWVVRHNSGSDVPPVSEPKPASHLTREQRKPEVEFNLNDTADI